MEVNSDELQDTNSEVSNATVSGKRKKKIPRSHKSLAILISSLCGQSVVLELKNDSEVTGILEESDINMNITLREAKIISKSGVVIENDVTFISGSSILYIHLGTLFTYHFLTFNCIRINLIALMALAPDLNVKKHLNEYVREYLFSLFSFLSTELNILNHI
jgi:small nuclear ribonucleoprotein (snRNP)-like protein